MTAFAPYDLENVLVVGYDVVTNRPKVAAYRAPGAPISEFGVESVIDELARKIGMDPIELREKNAAKQGTQAAYGPKFGPIGYVETLAATKNHPHYKAELGPKQGRGVATGFWFNIGGESSAEVHINEDGSATVATGNPDIGGSRASMAIMAAEVLGIDVSKVRPIVADTSSIGYSFLTGGSRVTFASGMAVVEAAKECVEEMRGPRRETVGHPRRRSGLGQWQGVPGKQQRRRVRPPVAGGDLRDFGGHRRADQRPCAVHRARRRPRLRRPYLRCRGR